MKTAYILPVILLLSLCSSAQVVTKRARAKSIAPPPPPALSISSVSGGEGAGAFVFTITKSGATTNTVSFNYATSAGTAGASDYTPVSSTATIAPSATFTTIAVPITDDTLDENNETFYLTISNPVNATIAVAQGTGTIIDNDTTIIPPPPPPPPACTYTILAADYGVSAANSNNAAAFNSLFRYIETLPRDSCKTLIMPAGARLVCSTKITLPKTNNLLWQGNNSVLVSAIPVANYTTRSGSSWRNYILSEHIGAVLFSRQPVLTAVLKDGLTFTVSQANAIKLRPGDQVFINTSKADPYTSGYLQGGYKQVQSVNTTTGVITVTVPFVQDSTLRTTDNLTATAYRPSSGWTLRNQGWELYAGSLGTAFFGENFSNMLFIANTVDGKAVMQGEAKGFAARTKDSYIGWGLNGHNIVVDSCTSKNFWDNDRSFGYGSLLSGEGLRITHSTIEHCKHGVALGSGPYYSVGIVVDSCNTYDAMLDCHPSVKNVAFLYNDIRGISGGAYGTGAYSGGYNHTIKHNRFEVADIVFPVGANSSGVYINSVPGGIGYSIDSNTFFRTSYGIFGQNATNAGFLIRGNTFSGHTSHGILLRRATGGTITGNVIQSEAHGLVFTGAANTIVQNNSITYGQSRYGGGILLVADTSGAWTYNYILNNTINSGSAGISPVVVNNGYNLVQITGNTLTWPGTRFTQSNSIRVDPCTTCTQLLINSNNGSNLNINTWPN